MSNKELIRKRVLIGLGLSVVLFVVVKYVVKDIISKRNKKKMIGLESNFIGADGFYDADGGEGKFIAKRFDSTHRNSDGTLGATWISYNDSDVVGYWEKGKIKIGTKVSGLV